MIKSTSSPSVNRELGRKVECQECGCSCPSCLAFNNSLDLHHEIEALRSKLKQSNNRIAQLEQDLHDSREFSGAHVDRLQDEHIKLRDRYERLLETYKKSQKLNHDLEDKLLLVVQNYETEKSRLDKEFNVINTQLQDAKYSISDLEEECERYRNDCNVAVQLLQCKPSNFIAHKLNTLPMDIQQRVKIHLTKEEQINMEEAPTGNTEPKMIRVHMPTFPPTAMFYSVNKNVSNTSNNATNSNALYQQTGTAWSNQNKCPSSATSNNDASNQDRVPMDLVAKVLTPGAKENERIRHRFYVCNKCKSGYSFKDAAIQTHQSSYVDANGYPRTAVANLRTNPPTIFPHYPGVHQPRTSSSEGEIINI